MELVIIAAILFVGAIIYSESMRLQNNRFLKERLKKTWGEVPEETYTQEKLEAIKKYAQSNATDENYIDDITWNDIDMEQIYMLINNTGCAIGEEYLYSLLRHPVRDEKELVERDKVIEFFQHNEQKRIEMQFILHKAGKLKDISVYEALKNLLKLKKESVAMQIVQALLLVAGFFILPFSITIGVMFILVMVCYNLFTYYKAKGEIDAWITVYSFILRLLKSVDGIKKAESDETKKITEDLVKQAQSLQAFRRGSNLVTSANTTGDIAGFFFDYLKMLFHVDIIRFYQMLDLLQKKQDSLFALYEGVGKLDSMIAVASYRKQLGTFTKPEFSYDKQPFLNVTDLYHPLIEHPVSNSLITKKSVLLTGSNASGKSTFIKTLAVNTILAQSIYTCSCSSYKGSLFRVASSMALRDNILQSESYYIVEIKSLKRILDKLNDESPLLCFIDEVLRGTNTLERIAASSNILNSIAEKNALCFAASHDLELTSILNKNFANYHFEEQIVDGQVIFDYRLREGKACTRNAIKLLDMLGYPDYIIHGATTSANEFTSVGEWKPLD